MTKLGTGIQDLCNAQQTRWQEQGGGGAMQDICTDMAGLPGNNKKHGTMLRVPCLRKPF